MLVPEGKTEAEVLAEIEWAVNSVAPNFVFGSYDVDDVKQEARKFALEALPRYDPARPLRNFLCKHVRNRLINLKRDKFRRNDPPCLKCHAGSPCSGPQAGYCKRYAGWLERNNAKANLCRPLGLDSAGEERGRDSTVVRDAETAELVRKIDENLPVALRGDYLKIREGVGVPGARKEAVLAAVREILR